MSRFEPRWVRARVASPIGTVTIVAHTVNEDCRLLETMTSDFDYQDPLSGTQRAGAPLNIPYPLRD